ncbi:hypothetical protein EOS_21340 [Caballeronia mineralivorans PML1(12)]|uniref:Uncharacterized protein n=1 Tax=Caballeronia mineralivorans PML1(12) TaxID=908627 RepID=A0A0J1CUH4_9BURK|nr:hypothetical protein EOS_21340 [Caballeronia mineralivorans PML1(12)]
MSFSVNNRKTIIVMTGGQVQTQATVERSPSIEETTERFAHGVVHVFAVWHVRDGIWREDDMLHAPGFPGSDPAGASRST